MSLFTAKLVMLTCITATCIMANPLVTKNSRALLTRDTATMNIAYCNNCISTNGGGLNCVQRPYVHWGNSGEGSCEDGSVPFDSDFCGTSGNIATPFGDGVWTEAEGCGEQNSDGTAGGSLTPVDTSQTWKCDCVNQHVSYYVNCGSTFACDQIWFCTCNS